MSKIYEIALEISGPTAMWTRPDTGATPVSYPVPPWSAAKEIFDRRLRKGQFYDIPCLGWREFVPDYIGQIRRQAGGGMISPSRQSRPTRARGLKPEGTTPR